MTDLIRSPLDSAIEELDRALQGRVVGSDMSDTSRPVPDTIARIDALAADISDRIAKLNAHQNYLGDLRKIISGDVGEAAADTSVSGAVGEAADTSVSGAVDGLPALPTYFECGFCGFLYYEAEGAVSHDCYGGPNRLDDKDLDYIHRQTGYKKIHVERNEPVERPGHTPTPKVAEPSEPVASTEPATAGQIEPIQPDCANKTHGLRLGSKRHRIYIATKKLLEHQESIHIDDLLSKIQSLDVFEDVKDRRTNLFNVLSHLKSKGLLDSDNRGNWSCRDEAGEEMRMR